MALLGALFGAAATLALVGYGKLNAIRPNPVPQLTATITPQLVADGECFARTCASCHAANGQLRFTGQDFFWGRERSGDSVGPSVAAGLQLEVGN